jgi:hypothetical protein
VLLGESLDRSGVPKHQDECMRFDMRLGECAPDNSHRPVDRSGARPPSGQASFAGILKPENNGEETGNGKMSALPSGEKEKPCLARKNNSSRILSCALLSGLQKQVLRAAIYPLHCAPISETMFRHAVIIFIRILLLDNFF